MIGLARGTWPARAGLDVLRACRVEQLRRRHVHIAMDGELVVTPAAIDMQRRDAPRIDQRWMQRGAVLLARQHLAESVEAHRPGAELRQPCLERRPDSGRVQRGLPSRATRTTLESVPTNEVGMPGRGRDIAEARHVNAVGTFPDRAAVGPAVEYAAGAAPLDVIHDVATDLPTRVANP